MKSRRNVQRTWQSSEAAPGMSKGVPPAPKADGVKAKGKDPGKGKHAKLLATAQRLQSFRPDAEAPAEDEA